MPPNRAILDLMGLNFLSVPLSALDAKIGCKSAWTVDISPIFLINRMTIDLQNRQSLSSPSRILVSII